MFFLYFLYNRKSRKNKDKYFMEMNWGRRNITGCLPFIFGLVIGLLISYGIRLISSRSFVCRRHLSEPEQFIIPVTNHHPDQVLNLAFSESQNKNVVNNQSNSKVKDNNHPSKICSKGIQKCTFDGNTNNKSRELLFVGVMTAHTYLENRAKAVWETWAKEIPGKVIFFTGGNSFAFNHDNGGETNEESESRKKEWRKSFLLNESQFPLVPLPGVDDSYPPQKKSFMMLKYMYDHYGNDFEWFMRADDDVYLRSDKLAEFLRSIDSRNLYFIGQAGKGNEVEKGTLNLTHNENFCMGGPGIIMSRSTLAKVAPRVQDCLKNMYSTHEDVEVGRCVQRFAGISCTWAYEMQTIFHHNSSGEQAFTGKLKRREVHKAITLHPIKNPQNLYRLHAYFKSLEIQDLLYEKILIHRDLLSLAKYKTSIVNSPLEMVHAIESLSKKFDKEDYYYNTTGLPIGLNKFRPRNEKEIVEWDFIAKGIYSTNFLSPKQKSTGDARESMEDVIRELMDIINGYSRARGRIVDFKEILYGYRRVNPLHGVDYILDLLMTYKKYRGRKITIPVRRHVYIQRPFSPLQIHSIINQKNNNFQKLPRNEVINNRQSNETTNYSSQKPTTMVMVMGLSGRFETFQRFLDSFSQACLDLSKTQKRTINDQRYNETFDKGGAPKTKAWESFHLSLIVVYFGSDLEKEKFLELVNKKRASLITSSRKETVCGIKMVQVDGVFSRGVALETGISQCNEDDLLFLIDVDLTFTASGLYRAYLNTKQNQQVYFPIVFSLYNPGFYSDSDNNSFSETSIKKGLDHKSIEFQNKLQSSQGYWREFGYGIVAFYKSDFRMTGGFDTSIKGWGKEDVALFDRFVHHTNLTIFRAPDPDLIHVFHETGCDKSLSRTQYEMCLGSQASTLGTSENLMKYIFYHREKYNRFKHLFE